MTEVFGKPVTGDITAYDKTDYEQHDPKLFVDALDNLLADPRVESIRWEQYTPFFNDGEPCEFGVHEARIKLINLNDGGDYGDGYLDNYEFRDYSNGYSNPPVLIKEIEGVNIEGLYELIQAIPGTGHHEDWLRKTFGEHAQVTATREGYDVEYYEHD